MSGRVIFRALLKHDVLELAKNFSKEDMVRVGGAMMAGNFMLLPKYLRVFLDDVGEEIERRWGESE